MRTRFWRGLIVLAICLGLPAGYAFAQGKGHGGGKDKSERFDRDRDHDRGEEARHVHKSGPGHVELGHIFPPKEPGHRPPGWDKGKKTGWRDCDVPPGQAKKVGCEPGTVHRRRRTHHTVATNRPPSRRLPPKMTPNGNPQQSDHR